MEVDADMVEEKLEEEEEEKKEQGEAAGKSSENLTTLTWQVGNNR